jgi:lipopolysaccharide/colanic/teichoic acid biosynthesis glycosyltransferase
MSTIATFSGELVPEQAPGLPEKLGSAGLSLVVSDAINAVLLLLIAALFHRERDTLLALTPLIAFAWWSGRYRISYASAPADELYATLAFSVPAGVLSTIAVPFMLTSWTSTMLVSFGWTAIASASAIVICARRRGTHPCRSGNCSRVDHIGRARTRSTIIRSSIAFVDFFIALAALLVLSPIMLLSAIAVVRDDGFPIVFRQRRTGLNDRQFMMLKFRTMRKDAGSEWVEPGDDRITCAGGFLRRTSLDELPQLWNVLKGEMSLVGPRPEMAEYADRFSRDIADYCDRHLVPPGMTGWAQLHYPRNFGPEAARAVLAYDLFYVRNRSLPLYAYCLAKTTCEVLAHRAV